MPFRIEFETNLEQATWAAAAVRGIASLWVEDDTKLYQVELATAEAVNNAATYSEGKVQIEIGKSRNGLSLQIWSAGPPLESDLKSLSELQDLDLSDLNSVEVRGRGFFILQQLTTDLSLDHFDGKNCLSFRIPL